MRQENRSWSEVLRKPSVNVPIHQTHSIVATRMRSSYKNDGQVVINLPVWYIFSLQHLICWEHLSPESGSGKYNPICWINYWMQWSNYTFLNILWSKPVRMNSVDCPLRSSPGDLGFILFRTRRYGIVNCTGFRKKTQPAVYSVMSPKVALNQTPYNTDRSCYAVCVYIDHMHEVCQHNRPSPTYLALLFQNSPHAKSFISKWIQFAWKRTCRANTFSYG